MKAGDIVENKNGEPLRSGCTAYPTAIVVSVDPFILESHGATMRWSETVSASQFDVVGEYINFDLERFNDCSSCKHDGMQPFFPSACSGCNVTGELLNFEPRK